MAMFKLPLNP